MCLEKSLCCSKNDDFLGKENLEKSARNNCTMPANAQNDGVMGPIL